jgi:hypothetical protein
MKASVRIIGTPAENLAPPEYEAEAPLLEEIPWYLGIDCIRLL